MRKYSKILFNTYPVAFHTKGGGEIQMLQYRDRSIKNGYDIDLFNQWIPNLFIDDINIFASSFNEIRNLFVAENVVIVNSFFM